MSRLQAARRLSRKISTISLLVLLGGCLSQGETDTPDDGPGSDPEPVAMHRINGSVGDGPVIDAEIRITARSGRALATTRSTAGADYDAEVEAEDSDYPLGLLAIGGTDLVTMTNPDFDLLSVVRAQAEISVANLNPFTTVGVELARDLPGGMNAANVDSAMQIVTTELNSGLTTLTGNAVLQTAVSGGNVAELLRASEALGELVRRVRDSLAAAGRPTSGNAVVAALGSDLVDGVLDGRGGPRADLRMAALAGLLRGQVAVETMRNELRVQGSVATARIADAIAQVFSGTPSPALEDLRVTRELLEAAELGVLAASVLQPGADLDQLLAELAALTPGATAAQVRALLSGDGRAGFDLGVVAVANASEDDLLSVIAVLRGGEEPPANRAPTISGTPQLSIPVDTAWSFTPTAADADGDTLSFSVSGMPSWASFDPANGRLSGTPAAVDVGSTQGIVISVTDGIDTASLPAFTLTVLPAGVNAPPQISGTPASDVLSGLQYRFVPVATDADGDSLSFSISNRPAWASFDTATGELAGVPGDVDAGTYSNIVISVSDGEASDSLPAFSITVSLPAVNTPPTIAGTPAATVTVDESYSFRPQASDADGDTLTFSISGRPSWANFNTNNGRLSGTPRDGDVGQYNNIRITVSDGEDSATLGPFSISVEAIVLGSATLTWTPPTENTDGSALTNLAGYRIYWGQSPGNYTNSVTVNNPGLSSYVVDNLSPGTWYFISTALNDNGAESDPSNEASKTIQ